MSQDLDNIQSGRQFYELVGDDDKAREWVEKHHERSMIWASDWTDLAKRWVKEQRQEIC